MSDKELILDSIRRMPDKVTAAEILERVKFIAGIEEAERSLELGRGVPVEEVMKQFRSWIKKS